MKKVAPGRDALALEQIPNIGRKKADSLRQLDIREPADLVGKDPFELYRAACRTARSQHDPSVIDTFISAIRFVNGEPARSWWSYTSERKRTLSRGLDRGDVNRCHRHHSVECTLRGSGSGNCVPVAIGLNLVNGGDLKRTRFVVLECWSAI